MNILVIDDEIRFAEMLKRSLEQWGHAARMAHTAAEGLGRAREGWADLLLLDVQMPDRNGLDLLNELQADDQARPVVVLTGMGSSRGAVTAMQRGAVNYLEKPFEPAELKDLLARQAGLLEAQRRFDDEQREREARALDGFLLLRSPAMKALYRRLDAVAAQDLPVLLSGETGTGKRPLAHLLHLRSPRREGPWVEAGSADPPKDAWEAARGGTLFLDEVGDLAPDFQARLLKVLERVPAPRMDGDRSAPAEVRLVAATNRDLPAEVRAGRFRHDLYYRLNVYHLVLPPLRERPEDLRDLARHFAQRAAERFGRPLRAFGPEDLALFESASWPGNARELRNLVERATLEDLPLAELMAATALPARRAGRPPALPARPPEELKDMLERFQWNRSELARHLGVSRPTLLKALKQAGLGGA